MKPCVLNKGQRTNVSTYERRPRQSPRLPQPPTSMGEHPLRPIDTKQPHSGNSPDRHGHATGAAAQLENRPLRLPRQALPEGDILPPQCLRILPVVELRVVIPTVPALGLLWALGLS